MRVRLVSVWVFSGTLVSSHMQKRKARLIVQRLNFISEKTFSCFHECTTKGEKKKQTVVAQPDNILEKLEI